MSRIASLLAALVALAAFASPAAAGDCTYEDLQGAFTITVDCEGLKDHSGIGQEQKRIWLAGTWGQLHIIELPEPYKTVDLDTAMETLGRFWTKQKTVGPTEQTTVAGLDARVHTKRKARTTSRTWVFSLGGRNLYVRAVTYGKRSEREAQLDAMTEAFLAGFKLTE